MPCIIYSLLFMPTGSNFKGPRTSDVLLSVLSSPEEQAASQWQSFLGQNCRRGSVVSTHTHTHHTHFFRSLLPFFKLSKQTLKKRQTSKKVNLRYLLVRGIWQEQSTSYV